MNNTHLENKNVKAFVASFQNIQQAQLTKTICKYYTQYPQKFPKSKIGQYAINNAQWTENELNEIEINDRNSLIQAYIEKALNNELHQQAQAKHHKTAQDVVPDDIKQRLQNNLKATSGKKTKAQPQKAPSQGRV